MIANLSKELQIQISKMPMPKEGEKLLYLIFAKVPQQTWEFEPIEFEVDEWIKLHDNKPNAHKKLFKALEEIHQIYFTREDGAKYKAIKRLEILDKKNYLAELDVELAEHIVDTRIIFRNLIKFEEKQMQES